MPDSKPGSNTWKLALEERFEVKPRITRENNRWFCDGGTMIVGAGETPEAAYVDHVEEAWCLAGDFPEGYPE